jgi:hypothetical protein
MELRARILPDSRLLLSVRFSEFRMWLREFCDPQNLFDKLDIEKKRMELSERILSDSRLLLSVKTSELKI